MFSSLRSVARLNQLSQWFSMPKPLSLFSTLSASTPISTSSLNEEVVFNKNLNGRIITLNRPKAFNALNLNMIQQIKQKLQVWEESDQANVIILKSDHPKAFCAGGDVKTIVQKLNSGDSEYGLQFFTHEYQLNHLIGTFRKPIVALMDGITMGGGVGLSVHAPFRVVTEKTVFAMPETAIGFFPDVGATFFLPRLEGSWGSFLGLTGHRLEAGDLTRLGLATHYIPSQQLPFLQQRLSELPSLNWESVYLTLEAFAQVPPPPKTVLEHGAWIQRCFQHTELPAILHALRQETNDTAQSVLASLSTMCPMTLQLTLMQIQAGKHLDFASAFQLEWGLAKALYSHPDFIEGVTAKLIEKRPPQWSTQYSVAHVFGQAKSYAQQHGLKLVRKITYSQSPYTVFGFPPPTMMSPTTPSTPRSSMTTDPSTVSGAWPTTSAVVRFREYMEKAHGSERTLFELVGMHKVGLNEHWGCIQKEKDTGVH